MNVEGNYMEMEKEIVLLKLLNNHNCTSQREVANLSNLSLGLVNTTMHSLLQNQEIEIMKDVDGSKHYGLTKHGSERLECSIQQQRLEKILLKNSNDSEYKPVTDAVILAAGSNSHFDCPIGMLPIQDGIRIIDRIIDECRNIGIKRIIVVVGYQKEMLYKSLQAYPEIIFVENSHYKWSGTMYSLSKAKAYLKNDFLLIEADHVFERELLYDLQQKPYPDCLLLSKLYGGNNDAYVELDKNGHLYRISKDIHQLNRINGCLSGLHKISLNLFCKMMDAYADNENPYLNYEYVIENVGRIYEIHTMFQNESFCVDINDAEQYRKLVEVSYPLIKKRDCDFDQRQIELIFSQIMNIDAADILKIGRIGGMTNINYKVDTVHQSYVCRLPGPCTERMISRKHEKHNEKQAFTLGLGAETCYFNEDTGLKISLYINHAETLNSESAQLENNIAMTTEVIRKLHQSKAAFISNFSAVEELKKYENLVEREKGTFYEEYDRAKQIFFALQQNLEQIGLEKKPCHNDLVPENFIKTQNQMYLIDWEYAGYNDPLWDVAAHLLECEFTPEKEELFLQYYFLNQDIKKADKKKILMFKIQQDILWSVWTMAKEAKGEHFGKYGRNRYDRAMQCYKDFFIDAKQVTHAG